jgi:hypothetical protein
MSPPVTPPDPYYLTGDGIENRPEVSAVKRELQKINIFLDGFGVKITGVYIKPRPFGFDFTCEKPRELLALARRKADTLNEDNQDSAVGRTAAWATGGEGFRKIGTGPQLHLEIAMDGKCNAHIDSHGFVVAPGEYDYNLALEHIYWDLLSDKVPGFFGSFGDRGQVGPMIAPMQGLDGRMRLVFGITGHW